MGGNSSIENKIKSRHGGYDGNLRKEIKMSEAYIEYLLETCDDEELVNQMIDQFLENK